jgi:hypothetical protein
MVAAAVAIPSRFAIYSVLEYRCCADQAVAVIGASG